MSKNYGILYVSYQEPLSVKALQIIKEYDSDNFFIVKDVVSMIKLGKKRPKSLNGVPTLYMISQANGQTRYAQFEGSNVVNFLKDTYAVDSKVVDTGSKTSDRRSRFLKDYEKRIKRRQDVAQEEVMSSKTSSKTSLSSSQTYEDLIKSSSNRQGSNDLIGMMENKEILDAKMKRNPIVHRIKKEKTGEKDLDMMQDRRFQKSREINVGRKGHSINKVGLIGASIKTPAVDLIKVGKDGKPIVTDERGAKKKKVIYS